MVWRPTFFSHAACCGLTGIQKNFNEPLLLCAPTWPSWSLSFESHRTEGHVSENHLQAMRESKSRASPSWYNALAKSPEVPLLVLLIFL